MFQYFALFALFGIACFLLWLAPAIYKAINTQRSPDYPSERFFASKLSKDNSIEEETEFPSIFDPASRYLSVVVPAYNEEKRLHLSLDEMIQTLQTKEKKDSSFTWEIIVVDDGSKDNTAELALSKYVAVHGSDNIRLLKLAKNGGKGSAVRKGMLRSRGQFLLMADADGASAFGDVDKLLAQAKRVESEQKKTKSGTASSQWKDGDGLVVAVGSRAHLSSESSADGDDAHADASTGTVGGGGRVKRSPIRRFLMWGFRTLLSFAVGSAGIKDTQCGFKLFSRSAARLLFPVQHIERWAFDVELIYLASRLGIGLVEVPITWQEVDGSKVDIASDSLQMTRDILTIRLAYSLGIWKDQASVNHAA